MVAYSGILSKTNLCPKQGIYRRGKNYYVVCGQRDVMTSFPLGQSPVLVEEKAGWATGPCLGVK